MASTSKPLKFDSSFFSLDPYQSGVKPFLSILNTTFNFNSNLPFLGVPFDRTLSFKNHALSLRKKFHNRFCSFLSIVSASWVSSKESLCTLYKAFIRPHSYLCFPKLVSFLVPTHIPWRQCTDPPVESSQAVINSDFSPTPGSTSPPTVSHPHPSISLLL